MNQYGNFVASSVADSIAKVGPSTWVPLVGNRDGVTALKGRSLVEIQVKGPGGLAIAFARADVNGNFTTPTHTAHKSIILPANSIKVYPISDKLMLYGRFVDKNSSGAGGVRVAVVEYR